MAQVHECGACLQYVLWRLQSCATGAFWRVRNLKAVEVVEELAMSGSEPENYHLVLSVEAVDVVFCRINSKSLFPCVLDVAPDDGFHFFVRQGRGRLGHLAG